MTLREIAKEANVSISTVSRILNGQGGSFASRETQEKVWNIVHQLGYSPNISAQKLRTGADRRSDEEPAKNIICLYARSDENAINNPFFTDIAQGLEVEAYKQKCFIKYSFTFNNISDVLSFDTPFAENVAGVAVLGKCDKRVLQGLRKKFKNIVCVGLNPIDTDLDQVICDGGDAAGKLMDYIASLGHAHIGYIGDTMDVRYVGYASKLIEYKLTKKSGYAVEKKQSCDGGYTGLRQLMDSCPDITAVFCANDQIAIGAMKAASEMGYRIPQDISVASIDDIEETRYLSPALTSVHIPTTEMGAIAAKVLIDRINNGHRLPAKVYVPGQLIVRESCAKPRKPGNDSSGKRND